MTSLLETAPVFLEDLLQHPALRNLAVPAAAWDDLAMAGVKLYKQRQREHQPPPEATPASYHLPRPAELGISLPMRKEAAVNELAQDVHTAAVEAGYTLPREEWVKSAFVKLAGLGALVFLPTRDGKYLLQKNGPRDWNPGKLRPPGGHHEAEDETLLDTAVRELAEEFDLKPEEIADKVKFLGREYRKGFFGNGVFELKDHGLRPGVYQASNSSDERIELVEASLDDELYTGPIPWKLLSEAAHRKGLENGMGDKLNKS